jgi:hypothetical protein
VNLLLRVAIWWFGIAMMIVPLMLAAVTSPSHIVAIGDWSTYFSQYKEVLFVGIATGGLAIADASEMVWGGMRDRDWRRSIVYALLLLIFLQVVVCAVWYGRAAHGQIVAMPDVKGAVGLLVVLILEAFIVRCLLWSLPSR